MTFEEAFVIKTNARKMGTLRFTTEERARFDEAMHVCHMHYMEHEHGYAAKYYRDYQRLCIQTGRVDLLKNIK
jgi:hypothetical protein